MPQIAVDADAYAATRVGIFFPAHNQTPADGNLTGQCVTLIKWFLAEMTNVPAPFSARGDARYVGDTLVRQGHAVEVPYEQRRRGDIAVYKYGTYGHINLILSNDRVLEQNVNAGGAARKFVDGAYVYASRIGSLGESWRPVRPNIYRVNSYVEKGAGEMIIQNADNWFGRCAKTHWLIRGKELSRDTFNAFVGKDFLTFVEACSDDPEADQVQGWQELGKIATRDNWQGQIVSLQNAVNELNTRPTKEQLTELQTKVAEFEKQVSSANDKAAAAEAKSAKLELESIEATKTGNSFLLWIGQQLNKLMGKS